MMWAQSYIACIYSSNALEEYCLEFKSIIIIWHLVVDFSNSLKISVGCLLCILSLFKINLDVESCTQIQCKLHVLSCCLASIKRRPTYVVLNITNTIKGPGHCGFLEPINGHFRKNLELSIMKNSKIFRPPV